MRFLQKSNINAILQQFFFSFAYYMLRQTEKSSIKHLSKTCWKQQKNSSGTFCGHSNDFYTIKCISVTDSCSLAIPTVTPESFSALALAICHITKIV